MREGIRLHSGLEMDVIKARAILPEWVLDGQADLSLPCDDSTGPPGPLEFCTGVWAKAPASQSTVLLFVYNGFAIYVSQVICNIVYVLSTML